MERSNKYLLIFLILVIFAGLVLGFRSFLMTFIIEPIALLLWAAWRLVIGVDQQIYWVLLIFLCSIYVISLVPARTDYSPRGLNINPEKVLNRRDYWQTLINDASFGKNEKECLQQNLTKLLIAVISLGEQYTFEDLEKIKTTGQETLPPEVRKFLNQRPINQNNASLRKQPESKSFFTRWFRRWVRKFIQQDTTEIDEILQWMETELEIRHD